MEKACWVWRGYQEAPGRKLVVVSRLVSPCWGAYVSIVDDGVSIDPLKVTASSLPACS